MPLALDDQAGLLAVAADLLHLAQSRAGDYKGEGVPLLALQALLTQGQTVAVHRYHGQRVLLHLKEGAGMDGTALVGGDGEDGLANHGAQGSPLDFKAVGILLHLGQGGELGGIGGQDVEFAHAALDVDGVVLGGEDHHVVGQLADDVPEQAGGEDQGAGLGDLGVQGGTDSGLQVVAGQTQVISGLQQDSLQGGDGALGSHSPAGGRDGGLEQSFLAGKFHVVDPPRLAIFLFLGEERVLYKQ